MKILLTGASGLLGRALMKVLSNHNTFQILGLAYSRVHNGLHKLNLLDKHAVTQLVTEYQPDVILHSAAERRPDVSQSDPEATQDLNVHATAHLAQLAKNTNAWMFYISTNYIFDGTTPPYHPDAPPNPLNVYGQSKLDGEIAIQNITDQACILRLPMLYGPVDFIGEDAVTTLAQSLVETPEIKVDHWSPRFPTSVEDVAQVCRHILEHKSQHTDFNGIFHWASDPSFTKYELAQKIVQELDLSTTLIPDPSPPSGAPRPKNCQMDCSALKNLGLGVQTPLQQAIQVPLNDFNRLRHTL
ncbi:MAG: SDR family oxidoreductase [bacterium]|nr:SDR family oxidoreductase [bacterium]